MTYTALIRVAPIETLERHNDPAWIRRGRTVYNRLRFLPSHATVPLLVDHLDDCEIGYVQELVRLEDTTGPCSAVLSWLSRPAGCSAAPRHRSVQDSLAKLVRRRCRP